METAIEWQMKLVRWHLFCTFTFDPEKLGCHQSRYRRLASHLDNFRRLHTSYPQLEDLPFVWRSEHGEIGLLPHFHVTIAGVDVSAVSLNLCFATKNAWKHGISQVRLFDPSRGGAAYMVKGRFSYEWSRGANAYELRKFGAKGVDVLHISDGATRNMALARGVVMEQSTRIYG